MDFPDDTCRVEVLPEIPIATSDLEEFISAYLRDAPFAEARFAQRVTQALGRCNRTQDDRAVYVLSDPEFVSRFSQRRAISGLPTEVRADIASGLERADRGFAEGLEDAKAFLRGEAFPVPTNNLPADSEVAGDTARLEVAGMFALWMEDYRRAAELFDRVVAGLSQSRELKAFWFRPFGRSRFSWKGSMAMARPRARRAQHCEQQPQPEPLARSSRDSAARSPVSLAPPHPTKGPTHTTTSSQRGTG